MILIEFLAILLPLTLSPGPATIALSSQGLIHGFYKSLPFYFGLLTSTFVIIIICSFGFASFILESSYLFEFLRYAGISYILYLGIKLIKANPYIYTEDKNNYTFINGFTLSILNPKLFVMIMSIFSQFVTESNDITHVIITFMLVIAFSQAVWLIIGSFMKKILSDTLPFNEITTGFGLVLIGMSLYLLIKS